MVHTLQSARCGLPPTAIASTRGEANSRTRPLSTPRQLAPSCTTSRRVNGPSCRRRETTSIRLQKVSRRSYRCSEKAATTSHIVGSGLRDLLGSSRAVNSVTSADKADVYRPCVFANADSYGHQDDHTTEGWSNQIARIYLNSMVQFDLGSHTFTNITSVSTSCCRSTPHGFQLPAKGHSADHLNPRSTLRKPTLQTAQLRRRVRSLAPTER